MNYERFEKNRDILFIIFLAPVAFIIWHFSTKGKAIAFFMGFFAMRVYITEWFREYGQKPPLILCFIFGIFHLFIFFIVAFPERFTPTLICMPISFADFFIMWQLTKWWTKADRA